MKKYKWVIFLFLIILGFILFNFFPQFQKPILTLFTSNSTTVYKIDYYKFYAVYTSTTGGSSGEHLNFKETLKYNTMINFIQLKKAIYKLPQIKSPLYTSDSIMLFIDNKKMYISENHEIIQKLLNSVNKTRLNPLPF